MALTKIGNLKGPQGIQGPRGLPGASDVAADPAMAAYVEADDSVTGPAVQGRIDRSVSPLMRNLFMTDSADLAALDAERYFGARVLDAPGVPTNIWWGYLMGDRWGAAVQRVLSGAGAAKILCIGDSTTAGNADDPAFANASAWPRHLATFLHRHVAVTTHGLGIPPSDVASASDPRWTLGTGWVQATEPGIGLGGRRTAWRGTAGGGPLKYVDPKVRANRYDIYYITAPISSAGTFTAHVGAGAPVVVATNAAASIQKVTVASPSISSTEPLQISVTSATGKVWIIGVEPYQFGDARFRVANAGVSGSTTGTWLSTSGSGDAWNGIGFLAAYQPDLTIIDLGVNDAGASVPVADYKARMQTIADAAYAAGSAVMFKTMIPSQGARADREAEYVGVLRETMSPRYPLLDLFNHYGSWERNEARGWMKDWGHGTSEMYSDVAARVAEVLYRFGGF